MLEITPIQATEERLIAAKATGAQYLEDTLAYVAFLNGKVIALCQFRVSSDNAEIVTLNTSEPTSDQSVTSLLLRSVLSFIELCGKDRASVLPQNISFALANEIGFESDNSGSLTIKLR